MGDVDDSNSQTFARGYFSHSHFASLQALISSPESNYYITFLKIVKNDNVVLISTSFVTLRCFWYARYLQNIIFLADEFVVVKRQLAAILQRLDDLETTG